MRLSLLTILALGAAMINAGVIKNRVSSSTTDLPKLVSQYKSHAQFGGIMLWDAGSSDTVSLNGCNYAQGVHSVLTTGLAC